MIQEQAPRSSHCLAITVLLIILVFALLYAIVQFGAILGVYPTTQTSNQGQCLNDGQSFNAQQEAYISDPVEQ